MKWVTCEQMVPNVTSHNLANSLHLDADAIIPDSKVHGANTGGPHVGPMIWDNNEAVQYANNGIRPVIAMYRIPALSMEIYTIFPSIYINKRV